MCTAVKNFKYKVRNNLNFSESWVELHRTTKRSSITILLYYPSNDHIPENEKLLSLERQIRLLSAVIKNSVKFWQIMKKCNSDALIPKEVLVIYYRLKTYVEYFPTVKKMELHQNGRAFWTKNWRTFFVVIGLQLDA